jgi:glucosamine--fructose-6-phosphate aminotransferase (isomerizing)
MLEHLARIPVEVEFGSEFRYRHPVVSKGTALLAISQSGETLDTLEAVREAKRHGALTLGVVNTVGSTIARETDAGVYNHAGPEIGVASTKAVISQITVMTLITLFLGRTRGLAPEEAKKIINALQALPDLARKVLTLSDEIRKVALKYKNARDFLYIGRRWSYPVALEGALKIKEISYVHAEGYSAGEMKHGPLALIDEKFPTFVILPKDSVYEKTLSNMIEIKARKGPLIALATEGDIRVKDIANDVMYIPETHEALSPILSMIVVQLFAYHFAAEKGFNVDRPRNLAKSVTVE